MFFQIWFSVGEEEGNFNFDYWDKKGLDDQDIRDQWYTYLKNYQASDLRSVINFKITNQKKKGAVVVFPSHWIPSVKHLKKAERSQIGSIILYGSEEACRSAFLTREKKIGRNLGIDHWNGYNKYIYSDGFLAPYTPYIENTFKNNNRKDRKSLIKAICKRLKL